MLSDYRLKMSDKKGKPIKNQSWRLRNCRIIGQDQCQTQIYC